VPDTKKRPITEALPTFSSQNGERTTAILLAKASQSRYGLSPFLCLNGDLMSNRAVWNIRRRHEWLATPTKAKKLSRRSRVRVGLQDALERKGLVPVDERVQETS
jgi:hypothetical protein